MNKISINSHGSTSRSTDNRTLDRTDSSVTKLCDLHVYKVPPELWRHNLNNVLNNAVTDTVSVGIIRVPEELRLAEVRSEVDQQLAIHGGDLVPRDYVFLRSVGRSLTTLRGQQEHQLKAKHFLPPVAHAPDLYILEVTPEVRDALAASDASSSPLSQRTSLSHRAFPPSHHTGYRDNRASQYGDQPHQSAHSSRYGHKPTPRSARESSAQSLLQSPPNNHSFSTSPHFHFNSYSTRDTNNPHSTHNTNPHSTHNNPHSTHNNPHSTHNNPHSTHNTNPHSTHNNPHSTHNNPHSTHNNPHSTHNNQHSTHNNLHNIHNANNPHNSNNPCSIHDTNNPHNENNNPQSTHNDKDNTHSHNNSTYNSMMWYHADRVNLRTQWPDTSNDTPENGRGGQATHRQTTRTSHRQPPQTQATHRQLSHTGSPDVSRNDQGQHWSADNGGDSPDGSRAGHWPQDDPYGRRHRGQDGGMSRHARGNHSENDSEDEPGGHRGRGVARHPHKPHHRHSDEDEPGLSSDEEPGTRDRRQKVGHEKNHLLKNLEETRMSRQEQEKERADLMSKAKQIRHKTTQYRNEARDLWKKKYFEEKKRTAPLEDTSNMLQAELEALHGRQMSLLEAPREKSLRIVDGGPSDKSNHVIQCAKLRHEIEGVSRRVHLARMKLTSEMKLRVQAQAEMKAVRSEAMHNRLASRIPRASHRNTTVMTAAK